MGIAMFDSERAGWPHLCCSEITSQRTNSVSTCSTSTDGSAPSFDGPARSDNSVDDEMSSEVMPDEDCNHAALMTMPHATPVVPWIRGAPSCTLPRATPILPWCTSQSQCTIFT